MEFIKVIYKQVGKDLEIVDTVNNLNSMQGLVDGHIEGVTLDKGVVMIVNEEGMLKDLDLNFSIMQDGIEHYSILGDAVFVSVLGEDSEFSSLDAKQIKYVISLFN